MKLIYAYAYMQTLTKVISLSEEAYKALKKRKGKGESFSDIVVRITSEERFESILEFAGTWAGEDANEGAEQIMRERERATGRG